MRGAFSWRIYARAVEVDARVRCARARLKRVEIGVLRVKNGFVSMEWRVECVFGAGFRNRFFVSGALMGLSLCPPLPCFFTQLLLTRFPLLLSFGDKNRHCYATRSNKIRKLRLPGGKLGIQYVKKKTKGPQTPSGDHGKIHGVPHLRTQKYSRKHLAKNKKTVNRAYGGVLSGGAVRERIVRAFLVEEQKIVKKVLKLQAGK